MVLPVGGEWLSGVGVVVVLVCRCSWVGGEWACGGGRAAVEAGGRAER
jgi:hypothetical protein